MKLEFQYTFIIIFLHACLQEGMIFGKLRLILDEYIPFEWIRKPLYECSVCMSGIYTVGLWFIKDQHPLSDVFPFVSTKVGYSFIEWNPNWNLLWTICIVGGINVVLSPVVDAMIFEFHRRRTDDGEETE